MLRLPELPAGWRPADVLGSQLEGYVPISDADPETIEQACRGLLETRKLDGTVYVRPALVSVLRVRRNG